MADPNSLLTKIRMFLANRLDPYPDAGEAWCMECSLNEGRTIIVSVDGLIIHLEGHEHKENVKVRGCRTWRDDDIPPGL